jgi:hypothetical protein
MCLSSPCAEPLSVSFPSCWQIKREVGKGNQACLFFIMAILTLGLNFIAMQQSDPRVSFSL